MADKQVSIWQTMDLVVARPEGLYCPVGDFYIDPWRSVDRAVITHGHSDHAHYGSSHYLAAAPGVRIVRHRLGADIRLDTLEYGATIHHHGVKLSLHPAGHVLGSAQVRLESRGEVWVISGDYKLEHDGTCAAFEHVRCHAFIAESIFGLPIYREAGVYLPPTQYVGSIRPCRLARTADGCGGHWRTARVRHAWAGPPDGALVALKGPGCAGVQHRIWRGRSPGCGAGCIT